MTIIITFIGNAMNYSRQRELILKVLKEACTHPTADEIYSALKKDLPNISLATVYRNLNQLVLNGEIKKIENLETCAHFDHNIHKHHHFICIKCNKIYDIPQEVSQDIEKKVSSLTGLQVTGHNISFQGICNACQHKKTTL